ncbi:hypothetical protein ACFWDG_11005 [Peribacillus sp. NPDC060186]
MGVITELNELVGKIMITQSIFKTKKIVRINFNIEEIGPVH